MSARTRANLSLFSVAALSLVAGGALALQLQPATSVQAGSAPAVQAPAAPPLTPDTFRGVARRETDGVVNISTTKVVKHSVMDDPFRYFFGDARNPFSRPEGRGEGPEKETQRSLGSGFIVDKEGYVLTNRHVVDGADAIRVTLANGKKYEAKLVGKDARTDVALLKIEPREPLTAIELGDSDHLDVGEWVMAIGNPFGLGGNSVTVGVVSYKGRPLDLTTRGTPIEMIQTDASINPGNSGGPLLDTQGRAVGINTLIITTGSNQSSGVGFAVPINAAKEILPQLRAHGRVVRGWLGVQIQGLDEDLAKSLKLSETRGALVSEVTAGSPAEKAGLKPGDVVVRLDGKPIETSADLSRRVAVLAPGATVQLDVIREGSAKSVRATLGAFPDEKEGAQGEEAGAKGAVGVRIQTLTPDLAGTLGIPTDTKGVVVAEVVAGSPAEEAGLQPSDVIVSVNGRDVASVETFKAELDRARPTGLARLRVRRASGGLFLIVRFK